MTTSLTRVGYAAAALATAGSFATAAPASAAPTYPGYTHMAATAAFPGPASNAGTYVDCPPGKLAIASGSVSGDPTGMLRSGSITTAGTGSFASAQGRSGYSVEVRAHCVDAAALAGATTASLTVRNHIPGWSTQVRKATCPVGTVAFGGGGNMTTNGTYDIDGLYTVGTRPEGRSWTYAGAGDMGTRSLFVEAHCLPRKKLGTIVTVNSTVTGPDIVGGRHRVFGGARCPDGYVAFAGGAWFHKAGTTVPSWDGYLQVNMMAPDDRGWFVVGDTFTPGAQLTTRVRCTTRVG
jgi:hypothetical protein